MKTFWKVLLLTVLAVIAIKLLPVTVALGFVLGFLLVALAALGVSILAGLGVIAVIVAAVLAPIWIPVLAVVGLIALIKRWRRPAAPAAA
jgi:hypothetical protein